MKIRFDTPPVSAQQSNGLAVRYAAAKREVPRWRWYLMLAVIGLPLMYFVWNFVGALWWETAPGFVVVPNLTVKAGSAGTVRSVAAVGTAVAPGTVLLTVAPPAAPVASAPAAYAPSGDASAPALAATAASAAPAASAAEGRRSQDATLALLDQATAMAQRTLAFRRARQATIEALKRDAAATQAEADAARAAVMQAEAELLRARADAQARRQMLIDRARADAPRAAPSVVTEPAAASRPAPASVVAGPTVVASPFAGTVTAVMVSVGEYVTPSSEALLLQGQGAPAIEAYVAPSDAQYAKAGRRAMLRFFDGGRVPAEVSEVAAQTARIPAERVGPLSPRSQAILVRMRPLQELPARYRINTLPLDVRFETVWPWND